MSLSSRVPVGPIVMPRQPREARSSTATARFKQLASPGSRPITFTRRRVSPSVLSMKLQCRIGGRAPPGNAGTGQWSLSGEQALDRRRVGAAVLLGEGVDAPLHGGHQSRPGLQPGDHDILAVKGRPVRVARSRAAPRAAPLGKQGRQIAVNEATLPQ